MGEQGANSLKGQCAGCHSCGGLSGATEKAAGSAGTGWCGRRWIILRRGRSIGRLRRGRRGVTRSGIAGNTPAYASQEAGSGARRRLAGALQFLNLLPCLFERQILNEHSLRHQIKRIRARADILANKFLGLGIFGWRRRLLNFFRQILEHLPFVWGHGASSLTWTRIDTHWFCEAFKKKKNRRIPASRTPRGQKNRCCTCNLCPLVTA